MTTKALRSTRIVTPEGLRSGVLTIENGKIAAVMQDYHGEVTDYGDSYLMPGFVDIHVHGWGRGSFAWKGTRESVQAMSRDLVQAGVATARKRSASIWKARISIKNTWVCSAKTACNRLLSPGFSILTSWLKGISV